MEAQSSRLSRRSILKVAGAGAALVAGGAACITAPVGVRAQDAGKLTFWVISPFTPDEEAPIYAAATAYQEANGIEVVIESTALRGRRFA